MKTRLYSGSIYETSMMQLFCKNNLQLKTIRTTTLRYCLERISEVVYFEQTFLNEKFCQYIQFQHIVRTNILLVQHILNLFTKEGQFTANYYFGRPKLLNFLFQFLLI